MRAQDGRECSFPRAKPTFPGWLIYLDSSVALAQLFGEGRSPPEALWQGPLVSSRPLEYEIWNRERARGFGPAFGASARALIGRSRLFALTPPVLARALQPFPVPVRTLDCLHLATIEFIRGQGETVELASYDNRLLAAARALGIALSQL
jgi:hypothetical protein